ncbi:MAG TPA: hypothetical protein VGE39_13970 [Prosthecobacter sp.]
MSDYYPPLVVGVIGDLWNGAFEEPAVHRAVRDVLEWLQNGDSGKGDVPELAEALGTRMTPVVLLGSLASAADVWTVKEALAMGMRVRCPLAFPQDLERLEAGQQALLEEVFLVEMAEDAELTEPQLNAQRQMDLNLPDRRHRRYRAAGEYVSIQADILIAICAQEKPATSDLRASGQPEVCRGVVRSRLQGLEPGLLPTGSSLSWADNGPVIRIYCGAPSKVAVKGTEFWHPCDVKESDELPAASDARSKQEMEGLRDYVRCFERLRHRLESARPKIEPQLDAAERLLSKAKTYRPAMECQDFAKRLWGWMKALIDRLRGRSAKKPSPLHKAPFPTDVMTRVAIARRMIADLNRPLDEQVSHVIRRVLLLSLLIVLILQANEIWGPEDDRAFALPGLAVLLFLWGGVWCHIKRRRSQLLNLQNDTRAIAEGLRVQFFWMAAGLSLPVAGHYLQRCRGEASWIRGVISNLSFPLEFRRRAFDALSPKKRHERLQEVVDSWVGEQEAYFAKTVHVQSRWKARREFFGNLLLIAGAVLFGFNVAQKAGKHLEAYVAGFGWAPALWLGVALVILWLARDILSHFANDANESWQEGKPARFPRLWKADHWLRKRNAGWFYWPAGLWLGWAVVCGIQQISWVPSARELSEAKTLEVTGAVAKNILFALGGLFHAANALRFATANCRRYSAMHSLFRAAHRRLGDLLEQHGKAIAGGVPSEHLRLQHAIQDYLKVLGEEALHENSAWLEMRRDKPVEPLPASG